MTRQQKVAIICFPAALVVLGLFYSRVGYVKASREALSALAENRYEEALRIIQRLDKSESAYAREKAAHLTRKFWMGVAGRQEDLTSQSALRKSLSSDLALMSLRDCLYEDVRGSRSIDTKKLHTVLLDVWSSTTEYFQAYELLAEYMLATKPRVGQYMYLQMRQTFPKEEWQRLKPVSQMQSLYQNREWHELATLTETPMQTLMRVPDPSIFGIEADLEGAYFHQVYSRWQAGRPGEALELARKYIAAKQIADTDLLEKLQPLLQGMPPDADTNDSSLVTSDTASP